MSWAERVQKLVPSAEKVRFTSSGTEATLMALRVARIVTGRSKILKFAGHFHGWHDQVITAAGPPHDSLEYTTPGVPDGMIGRHRRRAAERFGSRRAGDRRQRPGVHHLKPPAATGASADRDVFLRELREITERQEVMLIMDEVISGFRVHPGGMQGETGVTADLTTLAKILAGGLPGGCLAGRADLLDAIAFDNPYGQKMQHPGTYNGNPLSAAAGCGGLEIVATGEPCERPSGSRSNCGRNSTNCSGGRTSIGWPTVCTRSRKSVRNTMVRRRRQRRIPSARQRLRRAGPRRRSAAHARVPGGVVARRSRLDGLGRHDESAHTDADIDETVAAFDNAIDLLRADRPVG